MSEPMSRSNFKALHDRLMAEKPEGAVHDEKVCPFCAMQEEPAGMTYTEEDLRAKVDEGIKAATAELEAKIAELTKGQQTTETQAAVAAAVAERDKILADKEQELALLQGDLEKNVLELANLKAEKDGILAWLTEEAEKKTQAEAAAARKDERLAKLKEVAAFPDDYLQTNADRFAAMDDEEFNARCAEYAALQTSLNPTWKPSELSPTITPLVARSEGPGERRPTSPVKELLALRRTEAGHIDLSSFNQYR